MAKRAFILSKVVLKFMNTESIVRETLALLLSVLNFINS